MKRYITTLLCAALTSASLFAGNTNDATNDTLNIKKKEIVKKGFNFGPLPIVAFDADKGLQLGALLNIFDFGDGSNYPNTRQKLYLEASFFT